jgi:hypothetical protein
VASVTHPHHHTHTHHIKETNVSIIDNIPDDFQHRYHVTIRGLGTVRCWGLRSTLLTAAREYLDGKPVSIKDDRGREFGDEQMWADVVRFVSECKIEVRPDHHMHAAAEEGRRKAATGWRPAAAQRQLTAVRSW